MAADLGHFRELLARSHVQQQLALLGLDVLGRLAEGRELDFGDMATMAEARGLGLHNEDALADSDRFQLLDLDWETLAP